ncbi:MAG: HD domain-containing phosphohydrolase [Pseudomonadota bacterium]
MKILVVDDDVASRKTLKFFTKKLGHEVISAKDGEEALKIWKKEQPRIVVTDWIMPKLNGLELCEKIREYEGDDYTYIVIVTTLDSDLNVVEGMKAGADDYIIKPFNKDELYFRLKAGERVLSLQDKDMVIFVLAKLAESRDTDTGEHLERIRYYCKILAETYFDICDNELSYDRQFINSIFLASPLHDIGKVGIPDKILLKPGKLTYEEFEIMKTHTTIGYNTLNEALKKNSRTDYLRMSAEIALYHHEKFNGKGYPKGLQGEKIPLSARIAAIADVYDALVSERVYKKAFTHEKAKSIIEKESGEHFDPELVKTFLKCSDKFVGIHKNYSNKNI